jgi:hypothetical protein
MIRQRILAGSYDQARYVARVHGLAPAEWAYVGTVEQLRGLARGTVIWRYGTWSERDDAMQILLEALAHDLRFTSPPILDEHQRGC